MLKSVWWRAIDREVAFLNYKVIAFIKKVAKFAFSLVQSFRQRFEIFSPIRFGQNGLRKSVWWRSWQKTSVFQTKKHWFRKVAKFTVSFSYLDRKEFFISKSGVWVVQGARNQMDRFCSALNQLQWNLDITNNFLCPSSGKIYEKRPRYNKTLL